MSKTQNNGPVEQNTRMVDYFVTSGLDVASGLEPNSTVSSGGSIENIHCPPLEQSFKCKVLQHYPEQVESNPFDSNAVCMLSLPNGLQFKTQKHCREPKFHNFIITKENGERYYGSSFVFYEKVTDKGICSAMQVLQSMHLTELSSGDVVTGKRQKFRQIDNNTHSLPRHFKLSSQQNKSALTYYDYSKDELYVSKSIALVSQFSYVQAPCQFLHSLHNAWMDQAGVSLESSIFYILYDVTMPPPGSSLSFVCYPDITTYLVMPGTEEELPHFDFPIRQVFMLMGVDVFIRLYTGVLLEKQILVCSADYQKLMLVAEVLCCLLFPFKWPHVYVPILPSAMYHFLDAPVPYIMGLHSKDFKTNIPSEFSLCFVDLDNKTFQFPDDIPSLPQRNEIMADVYQLLNKYNVFIPNYSDNYPTKVKHSTDMMSASCTGVLPRGRKHSWSNELDDDINDSDSLLSSTDTLRRLYIERGILLTPNSSLIKPETAFDNFNELSKSRTSLNNIDNSDDGLSSFNSYEDHSLNLSEREYYCKEIKFNIAIRELFLRKFINIFFNYEKFIVQNIYDREEWLNNRDSMQNFDKTSFLSDQSKYYIPFLSLFLETQMFVSFIDGKIATSWGETDSHLTLFENRMKKYSKLQGLDGYYSSTTHDVINIISDYQILLEKRLAKVNKEVGKPKEILSNYKPQDSNDPFPSLDIVALNQELSNRTKTNCLGLRKNDKFLLDEILFKKSFSEANPLSSKLSNVKLSIPQEAQLKERKQSMDNSSIIPQTNWNFVEKLLKDLKSRTKKMLVEKMGHEALELGHLNESNEHSLVEESTLIAGLCDILEKIWSHGLQHKQGKSALWSHLCLYLDMEKQGSTSPKHSLSNLLERRSSSSSRVDKRMKTFVSSSPDRTSSGTTSTVSSDSPRYEKPPIPRRDSGNSFSDRSHTPSANLDKSMVSSLYEKSSVDKLSSSMYKAMTSSLERNRNKSPSKQQNVPFERNSRKMVRRSSETRSHSESRVLNDSFDSDAPLIQPLPTDLLYDVKHIQSMSEIKTPIGLARAWVRLSLERKLLSKHFKTLLSNQSLLKLLYKRYAFLRCEEEREQALFHLLSLNAVDYNCFTNTFTNTKMKYRVLIFPSKKSSMFTSANCWISISGSLGDTRKISIPKELLEFFYESKNVGHLTTLRIGHDNTGLNAKWLIDNIIVRNEITGATYNFQCGKWLGKGVDDDSIERLLIAEKMNPSDSSECPLTPKSPKFKQSNLNFSRNLDSIEAIETALGECVNNIVKHFHQGKENIQNSLNILLLGESGLVYCVEQIFLYGFKSSRIFSRNLNIWDLFLKIHQELKNEKRISQSYDDLTNDNSNIDYQKGNFLSKYMQPSETFEETSNIVQNNIKKFNSLTKNSHISDYVKPASPSPSSKFTKSASLAKSTEQIDQTALSYESKYLTNEIKVYFNNLIRIIEENSLASLGRNGKFQLFILLSVRDHVLTNVISHVIVPSAAVTQMYDEQNCIFKRHLTLNMVLNMLGHLNEFKFNLEKSLTYSISYKKIMSAA